MTHLNSLMDMELWYLDGRFHKALLGERVKSIRAGETKVCIR
jgi:hypothetical protein